MINNNIESIFTGHYMLKKHFHNYTLMAEIHLLHQLKEDLKIMIYSHFKDGSTSEILMFHACKLIAKLIKLKIHEID